MKGLPRGGGVWRRLVLGLLLSRESRVETCPVLPVLPTPTADDYLQRSARIDDDSQLFDELRSARPVPRVVHPATGHQILCSLLLIIHRMPELRALFLFATTHRISTTHVELV